MLSSTDTLHTTRSQLHFHTTTGPSLPLPCPHLLKHVVTDWSSANPRRPDLGNTLLMPLQRSSSPTSFSTFSPLQRHFIHLSLIYTFDLLVIWWYFAWFRSISTYNGWLMVGCLLLCLIFFSFFDVCVFVSSGWGFSFHQRHLGSESIFDGESFRRDNRRSMWLRSIRRVLCRRRWMTRLADGLRVGLPATTAH